jgi:hypothetical protein
LISDIPAGGGKTANSFLQCITFILHILISYLSFLTHCAAYSFPLLVAHVLNNLPIKLSRPFLFSISYTVFPCSLCNLNVFAWTSKKGFPPLLFAIYSSWPPPLLLPFYVLTLPNNSDLTTPPKPPTSKIPR